jgi:hypothetical protein
MKRNWNVGEGGQWMRLRNAALMALFAENVVTKHVCRKIVRRKVLGFFGARP